MIFESRMASEPLYTLLSLEFCNVWEYGSCLTHQKATHLMIRRRLESPIAKFLKICYNQAPYTKETGVVRFLLRTIQECVPSCFSEER